MLSAVYYSISAPAIFGTGPLTWYKISLLTFLAPFLVGVVLGFLYQFGGASRLLAEMRIRIVHAAPTSWDYLFSGLEPETWVVVNVKDSEPIFGIWGDLSFASSDLSRRDIYIQEMRNSDWSPMENDGRQRGVWISEEQITTIEFIAREVRYG